MLLLLQALVAHASSDTLVGPDGPSWKAFSGRGYLEVRGSWTDADGTHWQLTERLRPSGSLAITDRFSLHATVEASLQQGRHAPDEARAVLEQGVIDGSGYESLDQALEAVGCTLDTSRRYDSVDDVASLDRLHLDLNLPSADLRLGRQAISWGSGQVFNPTDVFAEYILAEPWRERSGVDAVRALVPIGERVQLTAVGGFDDLPLEIRQANDETLSEEWQAVAWKGGVRGTVLTGPVDVSVLAFHHRSGPLHRDLIGVDLRGDTEIGWWVEAAWDGSLRTSDLSYRGDPKVAVGVDYSFDLLDSLYVSAQLIYDGSGEGPSTMNYLSRSSANVSYDVDCGDQPIPSLLPLPETPEVTPIDAYRATFGRAYALLVARQAVTTAWSIDLTTLVNLEDGTGLIFPSTTLDIGSYLAISGGVQVLPGEDGEFQPPEESLILGSFDYNPLVPRWTALTWARVSF